MGRPRTFDETELLDRAVELFWECGYEATSIADLERHLGLGRQSLYNAFGDKHQLFLKALERYTSQADSLLSELRRPGSGLDGIRAYFDGLIARLTAPGERRGCFVSNSILEAPEGCPEASDHCQKNEKRVKQAFARALRDAVAADALPRSFDVAKGANLLVAQVYGLTVMSKSGASARELRGSAEALIDRL